MTAARRPLSVRDAFASTRADDDRFERIADGHYILTAPELLNTDLEIDQVRRERYQLYGELTVHTGLRGAQTFGRGILFTASINLSSLRDRNTLAMQLQGRTQTPEIDAPKWRALVDELCIRTNEAERTGSSAVRLCDVPARGQERWLRAQGFTLPERSPAMIFSDGDTLKTYTADVIAVDLAWQGINVGVFDWEMEDIEHADRVRRACAGRPVPENIVYLDCSRPLVHERDRIATTVHEHQLRYAIFDSAAFACHDKPEAADAALVYFREIRQLGLGSLSIAHCTKGEASDQKPFGSAFWFNSVRALWYAKRAEPGLDPSVVEVGFYPRKFNFGARPTAHALRFTFGDDVTGVSQIEPADVESLAAGMSIRERIRGVLRAGARTIPEIAEELGANVDSVKRTVNRYADGSKSPLFLRVPGVDGVARIGLIDRRAS